MGQDDRDLLPMGSTFDIARRGYDRGQVDEHLDRLDADLRILAADRDAAVARAAELAKQLENQRAQINNLEQELAKLATPPSTMEGLSERLQRMLRLAQDEAAEIRARAETESGEMMARAEADGSALRDRYQRLIAETEDRKAAMEAEHRTVIKRAEADAERVVAEATAKADKLEAELAARRQQIEEDFDIAMSARRADAMRALAEQEAASLAEAERRVREATVEANRRLQEATAEANRQLQEAAETSHQRVVEAQVQVDQLRTVRARISAQLREIRSMLADTAGALDPLPEEQPPVAGDPDDDGPAIPAGRSREVAANHR